MEWTHHKRAQECIAQGALTNSKRPECLVKGVYPTHVIRGQGAWLYDTSGRRYIDFICGLGSSILGYAHPVVTEALITQARAGSAFSLSTTVELDVAEKLKEMFPFVDRVKFLKTGSEACQAALRIARAATGKHGVLSAGYHGWSDEFVSLVPPGLGVPRTFEYTGQLERPDQDLEGVGAVIIEPIVTDISEDRLKWLRTLRENCTKSGTLLIFDEVITGFRFPKYSVSEFYGIRPDLICLGKAMANGMPVSVVGGPRDIMNCGEYFVSSTFAGEAVSLAAALKTLELLQSRYRMEELWTQGQKFINRFNELLPGRLAIQGYPTRGVFIGDIETKALLWQEACRAGILFGPSFFFNFAHIEHSDSVLSVLGDIATRIKTGSVRLEGELPASPFAQKVRDRA